MKKKITTLLAAALVAASAVQASAGEIKTYYNADNLIAVKFDTETGAIRSDVDNKHKKDNPPAANQKTYDIKIPEKIEGYNVESIEYLGFYDDDRIKTMSLPETLISIDKKAFYGADSLENMDLTYVESIGSAAFYSCDSLTDVILGDDLKSVEGQTFMNCKNLSSISFGKNTSLIDSQAFFGCRSLKSISLPDNLKTIGDSAFKDCSSLESVTVPYGTLTIDANSFSGCSSLKEVYLPETVTSIGKNAFKDCSSLESISIPYGCRSIDITAFDGCSNLTINCDSGSRASVIAANKGFKTAEYTVLLNENTDEETEESTEALTEENTEATTEFFEETSKQEFSSSGQRINLFVNGNEVNCEDAAPIIVNNRTLVPMRPLFEALDVSVSWIESTKSVVCKKDNTSITVSIGKRDADINGRFVRTQVAPEIINGYTYVPVRFLTENLNMGIEWNPETKSVYVEY